jgi:hypothetical protein
LIAAFIGDIVVDSAKLTSIGAHHIDPKNPADFASRTRS